MHVYITGIEGMIGSAIAYLHRERGDTVSGCDIRKAPSAYENINILHYPALVADMKEKRPDRVYHCAAMLGVQNTETYPSLCRLFNEKGTENVVTAAKNAEVKEFVFLSSSEVYGNSPDGEPFSEGSPLLGDNVYALGKARAERIVLAYEDSMKVVVTRMFNCFGLNQVKQFFVPKAIGLCLEGKPVPIYGSFGNKRSYLFGHDAAFYIIDVANNAESGSIVNVAHHKPYMLVEAYHVISKAVGGEHRPQLLREGYDDRTIQRDVPNRLADIGKLRGLTKHSPTEFEHAIDLTVRMAHTLRNDWDYERGVPA